jgi:hypothetical protein
MRSRGLLFLSQCKYNYSLSDLYLNTLHCVDSIERVRLSKKHVMSKKSRVVIRVAGGRDTHRS